MCLSFVSQSSKLMEPREWVIGTSTARWSEAQVTTWTCHWPLKMDGEGSLVGLSPEPVEADAVSR